MHILLLLLFGLGTTATGIAPQHRIVVNPEPPALPAEVRFAVYDVADLTGHDRLAALVEGIRSDAVPFEERLERLQDYGEAMESGEAEETLAQMRANVQELMQPLISDALSQVRTLPEGQLVLIGSEEQHAWVESYLDAMRHPPRFLDLRVQILRLPSGRAAEILEGGESAVLDRQALTVLEQGLTDAERITAPRLLIGAGQPANLRVLEQTSYLQDYRLVSLYGDKEVIVPEIGLLQTGTSISVRAALLRDGRIAMKVLVSHSEAERPFRERTLQVGEQQTEVLVQLPEVRTSKLEGRFDLTDGHAVLLGGADLLGFQTRQDLLVIFQLDRLRRASSSLASRPVTMKSERQSFGFHGKVISWWSSDEICWLLSAPLSSAAPSWY